MTPSILIRISMLIGVMILGGVTWFLHQSGNAPSAMNHDTARTLLWTGRAAWSVAIIGCIAIFAVLQRDATPARSQSLSIIAWALGEMVALFGGVVWYVAGRNDWYISGVIFLVLALLAFPGARAGGTTRRG